MDTHKRLTTKMAHDKQLSSRIRLLRATAEFEAALRCYADEFDAIYENEPGTTYDKLVRILADEVGIPLRGVTGVISTQRLQDALEELNATFAQDYVIDADKTIADCKKVIDIEKSSHLKPKYPQIKNKCKFIPGTKRQLSWYRIRSNPKQR